MGRRALLAAPEYNEPQTTGAEKLAGILEGAGFEVVKGADPDKTIDLVVAWLDGLMPPGIAMHAMAGMTQQAQVPVDDQTRKIMQAGMAATGQGLPGMQTKGGLFLPGRQQELKNLAIGLQLQGNQVITQLVSPPLNVPDPTVLVNIGMALAQGIPLFGLALGPVMAGPYVDRFPIVTTFEMFEEKIKTLSAAESVEAGIKALIEEARQQEEEEVGFDSEGSEESPK